MLALQLLEVSDVFHYWCFPKSMLVNIKYELKWYKVAIEEEEEEFHKLLQLSAVFFSCQLSAVSCLQARLSDWHK